MDRPLAWYHETFGFPDYGRSTRPQNEFLYDIKKDGAPVIEGDNDRVGFGDVRLTLKKKISGIDPVISILADMELPTGNARIGCGSGSIDSAIAVLLDKDLGSLTRLYADLGAVFPGDLKAHQTVKLDKFFYVGTGVEALIWPHFSLLADYGPDLSIPAHRHLRDRQDWCDPDAQGEILRRHRQFRIIADRGSEHERSARLYP